MTEQLQGVTLLPTEGAPSGPVDIRFQDGLIAAIEPSPRTPSRRLLAMPALVNAHDHARPLSPTSFGARRQAAGDLAAAPRGDAGDRSLSRAPWPRSDAPRAAGPGR